MMKNEGFYSITELCRQHRIERSFIHALGDTGLVHIERVEQTECIAADALGEVERFIRMHYELSINLEGLEAIAHLLRKVEGLQQQVRVLQNRLDGYEQQA